MALWDKLVSELIDIIQWLDDSNDTLLYRFPAITTKSSTMPN